MGVLNWMDLTISPVRREYRSAQLYGGFALKEKASAQLPGTHEL